MKLKTAKRMSMCLLGLFAMLMLIMVLAGDSAFGYIAIAVMGAYGIFHCMFWRCPVCGKNIGPLWVKCCPTCGEKLEVLHGKLGRESPDKGEEIGIIAKTVGNALSDLDFVVKALKFTGGDGKSSMSNQALNALHLQVSKTHECGNVALACSGEPCIPAFASSDRIAQ